MTAHICPDCNLLHDALEPQESDAVKIARIEAEARLAVARLEARAAKDVAETEAETELKVARTEAEAEIVSAVSEAEIVAGALEAGIEPEPEPVVIDSAPVEEPVDELPPPPENEEPAHHERKSKMNLGFWG